VSDAESASMWQSLSFGANYKAAYCLAVCPAGEDVIGPYLDDKKQHLDAVVRPLQEKVEPVYVTSGSDAEDFVRRRFPHKHVRHASGRLIPASIAALWQSLPRVFQRGKARGLDLTLHFDFYGRETSQATVRIREGQLEVEPGHVGQAGLRVTADSQAWLDFLGRRRGLIWLLLRRKIRLRGNPKLLLAFGRCFPS
jgi:hypothetical protein